MFEALHWLLPRWLARALAERAAGPSSEPHSGSETVWIRDDSPVWNGVTVWTTAIGLIAVSLVLGLLLREGGPQAAITRESQHVSLSALRFGCGEAAGQSVPMAVDIDARGAVIRALGEATPSLAQRCLEEHVRKWQFAPQAESATVHLLLTVDR